MTWRPLALAVAAGAACVAACGSRSPLRCARTMQAEIEPPTFYFLFDRSRSMRSGDKWTDVRRGASSLVRSVGDRGRFAAAVFPGDGESCAPGVEVMPARLGGADTADRLLALTAGAPAGGTPIAGTLRTLGPKLRALRDAHGTVVVVLVTDGGPNCNASITCSIDRCTPNIDASDPRCTPATNCCDPDIGGPEACLDDFGAVNAVEELAVEGIPVYVVGVPGSEPFAGVMDRMALAGGTARPAPPHHYPLTSTVPEALRAAFSDIVLRAERSCSVRLRGGLPDDLALYLGDVLVARDETNGWTVEGGRLTLHGSACLARRAGAELRPMWSDQCAR